MGNNTYRLCLLDTNAVSEMAKRPDQEFRHFLAWQQASGIVIPCASPFTIIELRRRPEVYRAFLELFGKFPFALVHAYESLLQEELRLYPETSHVQPILLGFGGSVAGRDQTSLATALDGFFNSPVGQQEEARWNEAPAEIIAGITELVANYPPAGDSYTPKEAREFVVQAGLEHLIRRAPGFVSDLLNRFEPVSVDALLSIKMMSFTIFGKFYANRARKPHESDAFDIIISSTLPYVDAFITERNQCDVIRQTNRHDAFLSHVQAFTLADFRNGHPS